MKHTYTNIEHNFQKLVPPVLSLFKEHISTWYWPFHLINTRLKKNTKKEWKETKKFLKNVPEMHNGKYQSYSSKLRIPSTSYHLLSTQQDPYEKAYPLTNNVWEFSWKMSGEWTINRKNDKTERIRVGRKMREETGKRNQMTALRFHKGGRHQKSPASLWGPTTLNRKKKCTKKLTSETRTQNNPNSEQLSKLC